MTDSPHARPRGLWPLVVTALLILGIGLGVSRFDAFPRFRAYVGNASVPKTLVRLGRSGKALRLLDYRSLAGTRLEGFDSKIEPEKMPSTTILDPAVVSKGLLTLSVVVDSDDLLNRDTGLITNYNKKGRSWERPAYATFFRDGKLLFATGAGLRVHGGKSRSMQHKSMRLYFRKLYGAPSASLDLVGGDPRSSIHTIVIHNGLNQKKVDGQVTEWHYLNPIAYEVARRIGCIVPSTKPVEFYINGAYQGPYVLTEHITGDFLQAHFGHDDFVLCFMLFHFCVF